MENFPSGLIEGRVLSLVLRVRRASKQKTEKETLDFFKSCLKIEELGVMVGTEHRSTLDPCKRRVIPLFT